MRKLLIITALAASALAAGCGDYKIPGIYRIDIQQGNVVTKEQLAQLEPGMDKRKVQFLLGTPLLVDAFNPDRWTYVYTFQKGGGDRVQRHVTLLFKGGGLSRIEGDVKPAAGQLASSRPKETLVEVPAQRADDGFMHYILHPFGGGGKKTAAPAASSNAPAADQAGGQPTDQKAGTEAAAQGSEPAAEPSAGNSGAQSEAGSEDGGFFSRLAERIGLGHDSPPKHDGASAGESPDSPGARPAETPDPDPATPPQ